MFSLSRMLGVALCALYATIPSLSAQTYDIDVVSITFVNRNLNDECSGKIIYSNLLQGDFDVDDDGQVPPNSAFVINIEDADPSNGNMLDGCGEFAYTIVPAPDADLGDFTFGSGTIFAYDITPPVEVMEAEAFGPFYTTELDDLTINTLPGSVSRSFVVDGVTTMPITNTIDMALFNRLILGGDIPRFSDGCSDIDVTVSDRIDRDGDCGPITITRTFTATDRSSECAPDASQSPATEVSYEIVLLRPDGDDVEPPAELVTFSCDDPDLLPGEFPVPDPEDYPFLAGPDGPIYLGDVFGNLGATYSDGEAVVLCANTFKFVRTWTVIDWCSPRNVRTFTQLVKVGDGDGPTITPPAQDLDFNGIPDKEPLRFSTNAPGCGAILSVNTGGVGATDGCSGLVSLQAYILFDRDPNDLSGAIDVNAPNPIDRLTPFLPEGPHTIRYVATDDCGNESVIEVDILIEDRSGPVVIAEDALNVALSNTGFAEVSAEDVDNGSYDDCTDVTLSIAFANPSTLLSIGGFGPSITLTCVDVGVVPVILKVTDENGNENTRMSILNVVDNSAPLCVAPGPISIDCVEADDLLPDNVNAFFAADPAGTILLFNELFGEPTGLDNCGNELVEQVIEADLNECGSGVITRTFTVTDSRGFTSASGCEQFISIGGVRDYTLRFPSDASASCDNVALVEDVELTSLGCDMVLATVDVDTFFPPGTMSCFTLRRTIEVINWCEYDGNSPYINIPRDADGDGIFTEPTYLHVISGGNTDPADDLALLDQDDDRGNGTNIGPLTVPGEEGGYAQSPRRGAFRYVQFIEMFDDSAPTIGEVDVEAGPIADCDGGSVSITLETDDDCMPDDVSISATLDLNYTVAGGFTAVRSVSEDEIIEEGDGSFEIFLQDIVPGEHAIRVRAFDGCGNQNGRVIAFTIEDNSTVSPICARNLTFFLMNDGNGGGVMAVEADDYVIDVNGNCGSADDVTLSIYREEEEAGAEDFVPEPGRLSFLADCDDVGDLSVRVYAFAPNGQGTYCSAVAKIEPSAEGICGSNFGEGSMAGFIVSPRNELLSGIEVHISDMAAMDEMMYTDENGSFLFTDLSLGGEYMVRPNMPDDVDLLRVKTSDIFRITGHILADAPITDPYQLVAADVTGDGVVNVSDIVAIRRVILGLDRTFHGPTWRFIRRDFVLEGLQEGWDPGIFPATFTVNPLAGHNRDADFIAVEIGDVFTEAIPRTALSLTATDATLSAGEGAELTLTAGALAGFQGTIEASEGLIIESWSSELLGPGHVNDDARHRGTLALSYDERNSLAGKKIITLHLRARQDLRISDYLRISDRLSPAEALAPDGTTAALRLSFSDQTGGADLMLHQNFPNPVGDHTTIAFDLPAAGPLTLELRDVTGRLLLQRVHQGTAGRNAITLSKDELKNTTGTLTYTITVAGRRLTKRMTVVAR